MDIKTRLIGLRGPNKDVKAVATTKVGMTKGNPVINRRNDFPGNSKRAKTYAPGSPTNSVNNVDKPA